MMMKVRVYPCSKIFCFFFNNAVFTDCIEKNITGVTPTSGLDDDIASWLLATLTVTGVIILIVTLLVVLILMYLIRRCIKHS